MTQPIPLRCTCGAVHATAEAASVRTSSHVVCYCDDCQTFARYLERADVLDASGGSEIWQIASGEVTFTAGLEQVACVRLSPRGLYRFYARCCRTPIGNSIGPRVPFLGVLHSFIDLPVAEREARLGKPQGIMAKFAHGPTLPGSHPKMPPLLLLRVTVNMLLWVVTGRARSPLFSGPAPASPPEVLSLDQRSALRAATRASELA